jgi:predicted  nucleic acid-binding Zn-ribbon protein
VPDLHRLLDVQDRDLALDQLQHRRDTLPERAAQREQEAALQRATSELEVLRQQLHDIERAQRALEDEVASIDAKSATENKKLNSGTITAPREIQALSDEIDALGRRKRSLEDDEIELMEKAEPLTADAERLERDRSTFEAEIVRLRGAIAEQESAIDDEIAAARAERSAAAADLPDDLLARYEKLRAKLGGVAVARLEGNQCLGCHVALPAMEVDAVRHAPPDAVVVHEDCGRILVR